jgi:hypothetical protein
MKRREKKWSIYFRATCVSPNISGEIIPRGVSLQYFYPMYKTNAKKDIRLSLLQSGAREVETLHCHQIVTKTREKLGKMSELQKTETVAN